MPYHRSTSRNDFDDRVAHLKYCAKLAATKARRIPPEVRDAAFHAAILETSAALEEYIKTLLEGYKYRAQRASLPMSRVPEAIRTYITIQKTRPHFERLTFVGDEREALNRLSVTSDVFLALDPNALVGTAVDIGSVLDGRKYPSPKNWTRLFARIGIQDIFGRASAILQRDAQSLLESFNDVRTALAHGVPPSLTYDDIVRHLENMKSFVSATDRILCSHLCRCSGRHMWPRP